jgi:bacteriocin biosynthesis cyclodehydratase domain-containing protein
VPVVPKSKSIKPWYRIAQSGKRVVFQYADSAVVLEGRAATLLLPKLLPLLDGHHALADVEDVAGENGRPAVRAAMAVLDRNDLLADGPVPATDSNLTRTASFQSAMGAYGATLSGVSERIETARVLVYGTSGVAAEIVRLLQSSGVTGAAPLSAFDASTAAAELIIAAPAPSELASLSRLNLWALETKQPWLQVLPYDGLFAAVGPLFVPWESACHACYQLRRAANVDYPEEFLALDQGKAQFGQSAALDVTLAGLTVLNALRWIAAHDAVYAGTMLAFNPGSLDRALTTHHVLRVPRCPACAVVSRLGPPMPWYEV